MHDPSPRDDYYRDRAFAIYHRDGRIEIDPDARISYGDDGGAYVEAWVWVPPPPDEKDTPDA